MMTVGVVTSTPCEGFVIVGHSFGYTAVELVEADHGIEVGDRLRADWQWYGRGGLGKCGVEQAAYFHRRHRRLPDAASQVARLTAVR
jgi:hypothetical protein